MHSLSHPFFSIIITVYNKREYLTRCLNSLVHLNANYEVIIIDDCSQDGSVAIAKEYAARNTFFRLIELGSNHDVSHARNLGVSEAQGEYILFADGDDWFTVGSLDTVEQLLERNDYPQVGIFAYKRYTNFNYENTITFTRHLNSRKHFLFLGGTRGAVHKGLDLLIDAFQQEPDLHLYICGKHHLEQDFQKLH